MLEQMGWVHTFEHETAEGFSLNLAQPKSKLAFEGDGLSHYLKDLSSGENVANGATGFKTRQLRSFGWTVAHISFLDWEHKPKSAKRQLLVAKLDELGVPVEDNGSNIDDESALMSRFKAWLVNSPRIAVPFLLIFFSGAACCCHAAITSIS